MRVLLPLGLFYILFTSFVIVGASHAVNLTDGLDGLAIVPVMIVASCFVLFAYLSGNINFASYLQISYIPGAGDLATLCGALIGASLGFLWFNAPPAKVFMGDTGSLALGGALGAISVATRHEFVLAIAGGLFVLETVSVILQVASFRLFGKRIFLMAPLHHHFEKCIIRSISHNRNFVSNLHHCGPYIITKLNFNDRFIARHCHAYSRTNYA